LKQVFKFPVAENVEIVTLEANIRKVQLETTLEIKWWNLGLITPRMEIQFFQAKRACTPVEDSSSVNSHRSSYLLPHAYKASTNCRNSNSRML